MSILRRSTLGLRFFADDLDHEAISRTLGARPTQVRTKGEVWRKRTGREYVAKTGAWLLAIEPRMPGDLDAQARQLFAQLTPDLEAWRAVTSRYRCDVFCGAFFDGPIGDWYVSPDVMVMAAERGLEFDICVYSDDPG